MENNKNMNQKMRERYVTCSEETIQDIEAFIGTYDDEVIIRSNDEVIEDEVISRSDDMETFPVVFSNGEILEITERDTDIINLVKSQEEEVRRAILLKNNNGGNTEIDDHRKNDERVEAERNDKIKEPEWPCGICKKDAKDNVVLCSGCNKWIHKNKCSGLSKWADYKHGIYRCPKCTGTKKRTRGRPAKTKQPQVTLTVNTIKELTKTTKSTKRIRRSREEGTPEKQKAEKSPQKKKSKTDEGKRSNDKEQKEESEIIFPVQVMGITLFKEDLESLDKGQYMTDAIMDLFIAIFEKTFQKEIKENDIMFVRTAQAYLLQIGNKHEITEQLLNHMEMSKKGRVVMPVTKKGDPDVDGGSHFSLLTVNNADATFTHLDPIKGMNESCAKDLFINSLTRDFIDKNGCLPKYIEAECMRQRNGFDCGPFVVNYIWMELEWMAKRNNKFTQKIAGGFDDGNIREKLRKRAIHEIMDALKNTKQKTQTEEAASQKTHENIDHKKAENEPDKEGDTNIMHKETSEKNTNRNDEAEKSEANKDANKNTIDQIFDKRKKEEAQDKNNDENNNGNNNDNNTNKQGTNNKDIRRNSGSEESVTRECRNFWRGRCKFGKKCWYKHTDLCQDWDRRGNCPNNRCKLNHPEKCNKFYAGECNDNRCRYLHPSVVKARRQRMQQDPRRGMNGHNQKQNIGQTQGIHQMGYQKQNFGYLQNGGGSIQQQGPGHTIMTQPWENHSSMESVVWNLIGEVRQIQERLPRFYVGTQGAW